jgi:hypothetical protein
MNPDIDPEEIQPGWRELALRGKPLQRHVWLQYRGVGLITLKRLAAQGLVEKSTDEFEGLSVRAVNGLHNAGIHTRKQAKDLVESGKLTPMTLRNFGTKSYTELCKFLGIRNHPADPRPRCESCGRVLKTTL